MRARCRLILNMFYGTLSPSNSFICSSLCITDCTFRRDEANHKTRTLGVAFRNLRVVGLGASASYAPTLASALNPINWLEKLRAYRYPAKRDLLSGIEGVVRPGEMICAFIVSFCYFVLTKDRYS